MKNDPIYLEAAERVALSPHPLHSCCIISDLHASATNTRYNIVCVPRLAYNLLLAGDKSKVHHRWNHGGAAHRRAATRDHRVYLLLMAYYFEGWDK